jgi:hypothetical protein
MAATAMANFRPCSPQGEGKSEKNDESERAKFAVMRKLTIKMILRIEKASQIIKSRDSIGANFFKFVNFTSPRFCILRTMRLGNGAPEMDFAGDYIIEQMVYNCQVRVYKQLMLFTRL